MPPLVLHFPAPVRRVELLRLSTTAAERQAELEDVRQQALEAGRIEGENSLRQKLMAQRADFQQLQCGLLDSLVSVIPKLALQSEQALVQLAFEVAQKLVNDLPVSVEMVEAAVRAALAQTQEAADLTAELHPDDLALLESTGSPLLDPAASGRSLRLSPSADVSRGGCLLHSKFGIVDARRETKLNLIRESLET